MPAGTPAPGTRGSPPGISRYEARAASVRRAQAKRADGDLLDARVQTPGARLELQAAELHVEIARATVLALEVGEQLPRLVLRSDEPERAGDDNYEEEEV
jgi:hypothetical protein